MKFEVVTALYDINRENIGDGRSINQYLSWFKKTLKLNCPMTIFVEDKFLDFVVKERVSNETNIIVEDLSKCPFFKWSDYSKKTINSSLYKEKMSDTSRVECVNHLYNIIQYSKFGWIKRAKEFNKFNSDYYFWMDAGLSRFFYDVNLDNPWPNKEKVLKDKILLQGQKNIHSYLPSKTIDEYIWDNNSVIAGGLFGTPKELVDFLFDKVNFYFESTMVKNKCINNEQFMFAILFKEFPEIFDVKLFDENRPLPLFKNLSY